MTDSTTSEIIKTSFRDWTMQQLEDTFGLRDERTHPPMVEWLKVSLPTDPKVCADIEHLREKLDRHARGWNEEELKLFFIGPLLTLVDFDGAQYGAFADRLLTAVVDGYELSGIVDGVIARGRYEPVTPYFCLQEYKPEKGREPDPAAQVLSAMLAARKLNRHPREIHGCYVIGRLWFFLTLDQSVNTYTISPSYDASSADVLTIFAMLAKLKCWVIRQVESLPAR